MARAILIYDAACPMCQRARAWVEHYAFPETMEYVACQSEERALRAPQVPEEACMEALQLVTADGRVYSGDQALRQLLPYLKRWRWLAWGFRLPGASRISPFVYRWVARHRMWLSAFFGSQGSGKHCNVEKGCR